MKKILITGANSYIGTSFKRWVSRYPDKYSVDMISLRDRRWNEESFENYDVVFHTVGIAHVDAKPEMEPLYYKINRDLTVEVASKAKNDGVKQFIFMSSIIVYGESSHIKERKIIDENTIPTPINFYGKSKLQAENLIKEMENNVYKIAIIRPPMIYGKGSKGNYPRMSKLSRKIPFFPHVNNQRSMLHIDNLCELIKLIIDNRDSGIFFPQNSDYVNTSEMVKQIAEVHGNKIILTKVFNPILNIIGKRLGVINKIFGSLVYDHRLSEYKENYRIIDFKDSIRQTEL